MDAGTDITVRRPTGSRRVRLPAICLLLALPLLTLAAAACASEDAAKSAPVPVASSANGPAMPLFVPTDRAVKLRLLRRAAKPPHILIFGGSRATRIEPAYFERLTGRTGFNLAFQNGRPEDAWAFVNYSRRRFPETPLQVVWLLHVEAFREQGLSPGLVQEPQLSRWFPPALIETERKKLPRPPRRSRRARTSHSRRSAPTASCSATATTSRRPGDGRSPEPSTTRSRRRSSVTRRRLRHCTRGRRQYFEKTMGLLDEMGTTQVVVLMPLHPRLLDAVRDAGWSERRAEVVAWLRSEQKKHGFRLLDLSELSRIKGDPFDFYDGFHVKRANARRLVRTVVTAFPEAFGTESGAPD